MKYIIIGGRKCGTTSLEVFLNMQGFNVIRRERLFTNENGFKMWKQEFSDYQPIVIIRNPVNRAYSDWKYAIQEKRTKLNYRDYCLLEQSGSSSGELNPIKQSQFHKWFLKWDTELEIMTLEDMQNVKGFPKLNNVDGLISDEDKKWTEKKLNES